MGCTPSMLINHKGGNNKDNGNLFSEDTLDQQTTDLVSKEKGLCEDGHDALRTVNQKVKINR